VKEELLLPCSLILFVRCTRLDTCSLAELTGKSFGPTLSVNKALRGREKVMHPGAKRKSKFGDARRELFVTLDPGSQFKKLKVIWNPHE
jgi:hypothetical protein